MLLASLFLPCALAASVIEPPRATVGARSTIDEKIQSFAELNLKLDLSLFEELAPNAESKASTCLGDWDAKLGACHVNITLNALDAFEYGFAEPEDVLEVWRDDLLDPDDKDSEAHTTDFTFEPVRTLTGPYGASPFLALVRLTSQKKAEPAKQTLRFILAGMCTDKGWSLRVLVSPPLPKEQAAELQTFLEKCMRYDGKPRDPKWTDAEAQAYWRKLAPESTHKTYAKPVRSEHFIILSDFPSASQFAKTLEAHHAAVKKVLPFEEQKGRRLLPVLLFRTEDEYQLFYTDRQKLDPKMDVAMAGHAAGILYATSFDNDDEEDQLIDVSKQLMINRARCWGAGLWFRSGMRWYIGCKPATFAESRGQVRKNRATPLAQLLDDSRWGEKAPKKKHGPTEAPDFWDQSALWMEFLHQSPAMKGKFPVFVQTMAAIPFGDGERVKAALESIYGMPLATLQTKWVEYFTKK